MKAVIEFADREFRLILPQLFKTRQSHPRMIDCLSARFSLS
ncbi:hypothetical protein N44_03663 [Microcystis aeruginosa NIES-44]|uniref:Uncharacterized protein n=1 Tax=Microcystis aeruginosa NIES-44 TaxID=449439 RepID=A0A0A1VZ78_MICAE|nr:hypothetical protein N44_03663 [Microcystis aeruginosa NIES-44]